MFYLNFFIYILFKSPVFFMRFQVDP